MNNTAFNPRPDMDERLAVPYLYDANTGATTPAERLKAVVWPAGLVYGTVMDQAGQPVPSARVRLMRYVFSGQTGERTLQAFGAADVTDDRGVYRIFGVAPGEYVLYAFSSVAAGKLCH